MEKNKRNYIYIVKVGGKLKGGGANGKFKIYDITDGVAKLVLEYEDNIVGMGWGYNETLKKVIERKIPNTEVNSLVMLLEYKR